MPRKFIIQFLFQGALFLLGIGFDAMPDTDNWLPSLIIWGIALVWFVITFAYWLITRHQNVKETDKDTSKSNLVEILASMYKRVMELGTNCAKRKIDKKVFTDAGPLLFDSLGLVELSKWPEFEASLKRKVGKYVRKSQKSDNRGIWRYMALAEASKIKKELVKSKKWEIDDLVKAGKWLDSMHIGIQELCDQDNSWLGSLELTKPYMNDPKLRELIGQHISFSYASASVILCRSFFNQFPNNDGLDMISAVLVGSGISRE